MAIYLFSQVFVENITMLCSDGTKVTNTTLHICPTLMLVNQLPVDIKVSLIGSCVNYQAKPGESIVLEGFNSPTLLSLVVSHLVSFIKQVSDLFIKSSGESCFAENNSF